VAVWTELIWHRIGTGGEAVVNTVMNLLVPSNAGKFFSSCPAAGFSTRVQLQELLN
jgi:hypothetical protein